jgi:hypothetical protein
MGGVVNTVKGWFGEDQGSVDRRRNLEEQQKQQSMLIAQERQTLKNQQDSISAQKKAEQDALQARKKRVAYAQSGGSSFVNVNPEPKKSILG